MAMRTRIVEQRVFGVRAVRRLEARGADVRRVENANCLRGCYARTDGIWKRELTREEYSDMLARRLAWRAIPRLIRQAIRTAGGGNRTVVRCEVPGYSSRLGACVDRLCRECGISKREIGERLLAAGVLHICGIDIPRQWANGGEPKSCGAYKI